MNVSINPKIQTETIQYFKTLPQENIDRLKIWIEALESNKYKQGKGCLVNDDNNTFCCLGVACDLATKAGLEVDVDTIYNDDRFVKTYNDNKYFLPEDITAWFGFPYDTGVSLLREYKDDTGKVVVDKVTTSLANLNDTHDWSFKDIAGLMRELLKEAGRN